MANRHPVPKIVLPFFLVIILSIFIIRFDPSSIKFLFLFYAANIIIIFILLFLNSKNVRRINFKTQSLEEETNIATEEKSRQTKTKIILEHKIKAYKNLNVILAQVNKTLDLDAISENLCSVTFLLLANNSGNCILYLVDDNTGKLSITKTKKEDKELVIKEKEGDAFDYWVARHSMALLISDLKNDFRFDWEKLELDESRPIASLISAPLISGQKLQGILRIDNPREDIFSQDDLRFLGTISDIGAVAIENGKLFDKTQQLAIHDGLTGLYTKSFFLERLQAEAQRALRQKRHFCLLMIDIDHFKDYNDKFGHTAGDIVLRTLSKILTGFFKGHDGFISRFGGEEFCVILESIDNDKAYAQACGLCREIAKTRFTLRRQETAVTVSIGVAGFPTDATEADELIFKADKAMYKAKEQGRNRVSRA